MIAKIAFLIFGGNLDGFCFFDTMSCAVREASHVVAQNVDRAKLIVLVHGLRSIK